jgi:hypothetical protein
MLVVSDERKLDRIPELLRRNGIAYERKTDAGQVTYRCINKPAEVWITVAPRQRARGRTGSHRSFEYFPVLVYPRPGWFRWLFFGAKDRRLQKVIVETLEPVKDLAYQLQV